MGIEKLYIFVLLITCIGTPDQSHSTNTVPKSCGPILTDARHKHTACGGDLFTMSRSTQIEIDFTISVNREEEIWKDIEDFEGLYQVSNLGRIKSLYRKKKTYQGDKSVSEKIRSLCVDNLFYSKYQRIGLWKNGVQFTTPVHRVVAKEFIPNPYNKPIVNHKDGNGFNNRADNLEWVTAKENSNHYWSTLNKGHYASVKVKQIDPITRVVVKIFESKKDTGYDWTTLTRKLNSGKVYKGFIWETV